MIYDIILLHSFRIHFSRIISKNLACVSTLSKGVCLSIKVLYECGRKKLIK